MSPEKVTLVRVLSFFWTIFVIAPAYIVVCVIQAVFFFVNCFNYKNFDRIQVEHDEHHADYLENWLFRVTAKLLVIVAATFSEFWKAIKEIKTIQI